jgi:hypothetical protein
MALFFLKDETCSRLKFFILFQKKIHFLRIALKFITRKIRTSFHVFTLGVLGLVMRPINDKFSSSFHRVLFNISDLALSIFLFIYENNLKMFLETCSRLKFFILFQDFFFQIQSMQKPFFY